MKCVKNYAVVPNAEWWAHDLRQVAFDEAVKMKKDERCLKPAFILKRPRTE